MISFQYLASQPKTATCTRDVINSRCMRDGCLLPCLLLHVYLVRKSKMWFIRFLTAFQTCIYYVDFAEKALFSSLASFADAKFPRATLNLHLYVVREPYIYGMYIFYPRRMFEDFCSHSRFTYSACP